MKCTFKFNNLCFIFFWIISAFKSSLLDFFQFSYFATKFTHSYAPNHSKNRNPREIPCLLFDINIPQCFHHRIAVQGIEPCQPKPCQPLSNLQFLITEGFSVTNYAATIHKSPIDRNYCSSTRLSGDKDKRRYSDSNRNTVSGYWLFSKQFPYQLGLYLHAPGMEVPYPNHSLRFRMARCY